MLTVSLFETVLLSQVTSHHRIINETLTTRGAIVAESQIKHIAVIGAGTMGVGIAQGFLLAGRTVTIIDVSADALERCKTQLQQNIQSFIHHKLTTHSIEKVLEDVTFLQCDITDIPLDNIDMYVESLPEIEELKRSLFKQLCNTNERVILATNTSSMTVSRICNELPAQHRMIGLHYFNPAHIIPAVEVHKGPLTSQQTIDTTLSLMKAIGKQPVLVQKEVPGFIINRLTGAMEREIDFLLDEGVVSPEDLDIAVKASYGFRLATLGPMEAEDMIGLDTAARASANIFPTLSNAHLPSKQLLEKVANNELGIKSGIGWYDYRSSRSTEVLANNNEKLLKQLSLFLAQQSQGK
jgi:3-hydroxybutyryl-CoA dehydrogenase